MTSAVLRYLPLPETMFEAGRLRMSWLLAIMALIFLVSCVSAIGMGAFPVGWYEFLALFADSLGIELPIAVTEQQKNVLFRIRLPRVALSVLAGAGLAVSGAALQGLFRNPLADPGLIGVSSGAAFGASLVIVMGATWLPGLSQVFGMLTLPLTAFLGGLSATLIVYRLSNLDGRTDPSLLLLAGIAVNALGGSAIGLFTYIASDEQLRSLTFWSLGSLAGVSWSSLAPVAAVVIPAIFFITRQSTQLNALLLGEAEAKHIGVDVQRLKLHIIIWSALTVGTLVALSGMIGFIGLVAPHLARLLTGPDNRRVLPSAAVLGSILLTLSDLASRTLVAPAELPIGIICALLGAPFFLWLLARQKRGGNR